MNIAEAIALFSIMAALAAVPSTSVALVVTRSATQGLRNGIAVTAGIVLGDLCFIFLALFGLTLVAEAMGTLFMVVKYLGATYLLWLGFSLLRKDSSKLNFSYKPQTKKGLIIDFLAGFAITLGDIKAIFFYISLLPMFIDLPNLQITDVLLIVLLTIVSLGGVKTAYALMAPKIASLAEKRILQRAARKTAGGFMLGTGVYIIAKG